ncbi:MAG: DMT family transporter [Firmicutes bacterium]|nr:DMT family transporter [Bacillota bacterium]
MTARNKGIFLMVMSSLFFAVMAAAVKVSGDLPTMEKVFFRNIIGFTATGIFIWRKGGSFAGSNKKWLLLRSLFGFLGLVFYFYAIDRLPLANAVILNQMNPFITLVLAYLFLREHVYNPQWFAVGVAMLGILLIVKPGFGYTFAPALVGILSAFFAAAAYTVVRHLRLTDQPQTIIFYFTGFTTMATLPFMVWGNFIMPDFAQMGALATVGITATIAQYLMTYAYRYSEAGDLSIYSYSNTIFAVVIAMLVWQEFPDLVSIVGIMLVLVGAVFNWWTKQKADP